ncbi:MAG: Ty1/Copia family ribonuclease HI, partial [Microcystaceae cyanobacterium]
SNLQDRRSITGIIVFIDKTIYKYVLKRQGTIETSTFGAEFAAMRVAVEEAIAVVHTLHSIGTETEPVHIIGDNMSVINNTTIPGSVLKRKHLSIAYHRVREAVAAGIVTISHIASDMNLADLLTKSLPTHHYRFLLSRCMQGQGLLSDEDLLVIEHTKRSSGKIQNMDLKTDSG